MYVDDNSAQKDFNNEEYNIETKLSTYKVHQTNSAYNDWGVGVWNEDLRCADNREKS